MKMSKEFEARVMREGIVDTQKYRYAYTAQADKGTISRIELDKLDTTAAIDGWEIVKEYN